MLQRIPSQPSSTHCLVVSSSSLDSPPFSLSSSPPKPSLCRQESFSIQTAQIDLSLLSI
ncbi:hypothetical protein Pint_01584 [Pistacia integerrima]|uniref:Uncharacterized protein n=2 Tax=Pistacia TaxID=55512 RepID=A0ACC1CA05_9ROSI|nr:hypothetical protein Pint_01584 [Pistacia integerrima]KAJ0112498.1 hypothetical protein Patl1_01621 [Pistacia atlantica]